MGEGSKIAIINSNVSDNEAKDNTEIDVHLLLISLN